MDFMDLSKYNILLEQSYEKRLGKVAKVVGLTVESIGPSAKLNDLCHIITKDTNQVINAEVVGFRDDRVLLMPYDSTEGVGVGSRVENTDAPLQVMVSDDILGCVLDGLGSPMDHHEIQGGVPYSVEAQPPDPLTRQLIDEVLPLGVKAVDGLITVGKGQRIGIFAGSGVGKSTLLRAILFFYNADKLRLGIPKEKKSFDAFYFPYANSYIIYEVMRENGAYCVVAAKSPGTGVFPFY